MTDERIHIGLDAIDEAPSAVAIGFFDGVHRGHQSLLSRARKAGADEGMRTVALTFDRHPLEVVNAGARPPLLQTLTQRLRTLAEQDLDLVVALPFDDHLRHLSPTAFVEHALAGPLQARHVVVGSNFRFGHKAAGDVTTLADLGPVYDFTSEAVTLLELDGTVVSSTQIRAAVERGDVEQAARWLGRAHVLEGPVVRGDQRGRTLGYPTANLQCDPRSAFPAKGVYAGRLLLPPGVTGAGTWQPAAISVGTNPTFEGVRSLRVEAHLIDWEGDLYGAQVRCSFTHRLRDELKFDGVDALVAQMDADVAQAVELLAAQEQA